ncbi:MAG TPA: NAD(P)/FAD-dependent oxidoreductase [Xanthomonadales bacterium]|nr:NAD(P)/FAD-dependent oxidoreductase [Xanthomonadales bacterium]
MTDPAHFDVIIIGGGAAGMMCALTAGQRGKSVLLIEHANRVGKKILMSGGGRCNFTNIGSTPANFLSANPHFCKSALARYRPADFIGMVEAHGIAFHEKELGQLFCNDSSKQIVAMLVAECTTAGVRIETQCTVSSIAARDMGFDLECTLGRVHGNSLVIATGGLSIPAMGATGFGYDIARQFGHHVLPTRAGLVPLTLTGSYLEHYSQLSGVSLPVSARAGRARFDNAMLITHRGLSGPAILQISSYWQPGDPLQIDLLPGQDALEFLLSGQRERPAAELRSWLTERLPKRFAQRFCEIHADERALRQYNKPELVAIAAKLKEWPIVPSGTEGYRTAEVTLGGVDTLEVSSTTMESKLAPGMYFVGEVLDVTGHLGGYNFQWAWASGRAAGLAV